MHSIQSAAEVAISAPLPSASRLRARAAVVRATLRTVIATVIALMCGSAQAELPYRVELVGPSELKAVVEPILDLPRWRDFPGMTPDLLRRLAVEERDSIRAAVETEGYFSANVSTEVTEGDPEWVVRIAIEPGERTRIAQVDIRFSGPLLSDPDAEERMKSVRKSWRLPVGDLFRQADWDAAKLAAVRDVAALKYAAARVASSEARIDPGKALATLDIEIESGPVFRVGAIDVRGTNRYDAKIIERLNPLRPGDEYSEEKVLLFRRRLLELGHFASAEVALDADPAKADAAPLRVAVIEGRAKRVDGSIGFTTDTGFRVRGNYSDADLLGEHWRFRAELLYERDIQGALVSVDSQPLPGGSWNTVIGSAQKKDVEGQVTETVAATVARQWGLERLPSSLSVQWLHERQSIGGVNSDTTWATYLNYRYTFRDTDAVGSPRRGYLGTLNLGTAVPGLSSRAFLRATAKVNGFVPLSRDDDLLLRAEAGGVFATTRTGIPFAYMFRTGGDQTIRGYAFESIGIELGGAVASARYLALASAEATHWFTDVLGGAVFVDVGDAFETMESFDAKWGYGVGLRVRSPIGPFRVDVAYGQAVKEFRLHFSVGFSF
jgi:translocation and assembly module TamA